MPEFPGRLRTPRLASAPATPAVGEMYYNTATTKLYYWNGTVWADTTAAAGTVYDSDPVGVVKAFSGKTIPTNWMLADGRTLNRASYTELADTLGVAAGATTFTLPDLRSRFLFGGNATLSDILTAGGEATHILTVGETPAHQHAMNDGGGYVPLLNGWTDRLVTAGGGYHVAGSTDNATGPNNLAQTGSIGSGSAHNNLPPYVILAWIIKATGAQINAGGALVGPKGDPGVPGTPPARVTSLPVGPADGLEVSYVVDAANGVLWHLRYNAGSASAYKWEYLGGSPLFGFTGAAVAYTTGTAYVVGPAFASPQLTLPLKGDYRVAHAITGQVGAPVPDWRSVLYAAGVVVPGQTGGMGSTAADMYNMNPNAKMSVAGAAAGTVLDLRLLANGASQAITIYDRFLEAQPVRVG